MRAETYIRCSWQKVWQRTLAAGDLWRRPLLSITNRHHCWWRLHRDEPFNTFITYHWISLSGRRVSHGVQRNWHRIASTIWKHSTSSLSSHISIVLFVWNNVRTNSLPLSPKINDGAMEWQKLLHGMTKYEWEKHREIYVSYKRVQICDNPMKIDR